MPLFLNFLGSIYCAICKSKLYQQLYFFTGQSVDTQWTFIGQSMDNHWTLIGQSMDNQWTINGQSLDTHWTIIGQSMDNHWTIIGQSLDNHWTLIGQSLDTHWTIIGQFISVCRQNWYIIFFILIVLFIFHLVIYLDFWFYGVSFISAVFYNFFLHLFKLFHLHLCGFIYYI